jgi:nitrate reductase gamma subunit
VEYASSEWLIDPEAFHISAHGQTSCAECHGDIGEKTPHPDPGNVNKGVEDFFRVEQCEDCHFDTMEEVEEGTHGGLTGKSSQELEDCIACHDPHYAQSAAARKANVDSSRPAEEKCSACHEYRDVLPEFSEEDRNCMACHRLPGAGDPKAAQRIRDLCFYCHGTCKDVRRPSESSPGTALIAMRAYLSTPHSKLSCLECHPDAARYGHSDQEPGDCLDCHNRHDEKVAHDAHLTVTCQACHLGGVGRVHHMVKGDGEERCRRCHTKGNQLGAAAMVLPAKSVICMPCHPATLSVGDTTTVISLLLFLVGFIGVGSVWLGGSLDEGIERGGEGKVPGIIKGVLGALFSVRLLSITRALILDGLLQRRLFRQAKARWAIHALIFLPFVFRFLWGLIGLVASLCRPDWPGTWILLDKNHPATAFLFDLTGVMVLLGVTLAVLRRTRKHSEEILAGMPKPDWPANGLLAAIVLVGFLLEGMRIAMTGSPSGAEFAFVGYGLSRLFAGTDLTGLYGYVWYAHAILTGLFVAYLPFSRMIHMITVPLALALNAGAKHGH